MAHGRSGTQGHRRSGTARSDHREPESRLTAGIPSIFGARNDANRESFGFLLTPCRLWTDGGPPPPAGAIAGTAERGPLTHVTLVWREGQHEDWLRFGKPVRHTIVDRRTRVEAYAPGQVFGLVRWASNDHGTVRSTLDIVRAVGHGEHCTTVPQVDPGADLLLAVRGWPRVAQVFRLIDAIEASGIDPCEVAPDHWRQVHNRLAGRERPCGYGLARHRAWLLRRAIER